MATKKPKKSFEQLMQESRDTTEKNLRIWHRAGLLWGAYTAVQTLNTRLRRKDWSAVSEYSGVGRGFIAMAIAMETELTKHQERITVLTNERDAERGYVAQHAAQYNAAARKLNEALSILVLKNKETETLSTTLSETQRQLDRVVAESTALRAQLEAAIKDNGAYATKLCQLINILDRVTV